MVPQFQDNGFFQIYHFHCFCDSVIQYFFPQNKISLILLCILCYKFSQPIEINMD